MKQRRTLTWVAAAVLLASAVAGCRSRDGTPTAMERSSRSPDEGMTGIRLTNSRVGDTRWVLQADSASVFREKKRVVAEIVEINFYEEDEHVSTRTADRGILLQVTDDLEARGNVRVEAEDGAILQTDVLFWDHQNALIHTDAYVEITKEGDVLTGVGLEADPGLDRVDIKEEVRITVRDDSGLLNEADEDGG
jgi:LPS export ABC transporter protein LptC